MAKLIQASGEFSTEGEQRTAEALTALPANWTVVANKNLPAAQGRSFEIDFIVIGDGLVFAVDEKSWYGRITGSDEIWVREDGSSQKSPLAKIDYVAKILAGYLKRGALRFNEIEGHTVVGCILLSRASERPAIRDPRARDGVFLLPSVVESMIERDAREGNPKVGQLREHIEKALYDLSPRPKRPKAIDLYSIGEEIATRPGVRVFRAQHPEGGHRLLHVYHVAPASFDQRDFFLQEFRALQQLRPTGLVPECSDPFSWSDDFLVVPSHPPSGISLSAVPGPDSETGAIREIDRAATVFRGLARIHGAGVIHRAIGPESVYVDEVNGEEQISFSGFYAARRGDETISPNLDDLRLCDPYAAPEIAKVGGYGFATAESDTYSLALVFLERLAGTPVSRLVQSDGTVQIPAAESGWRYLPQEVVDVLTEFFRTALSRGPLAPAGAPEATRLSATACAERLDAIAQGLRADTAVAERRLLDGRYKVERLLGTGASARTFLVTDTVLESLFAVKQFLRPASFEEAKREFRILEHFPHRNLPRIFDVDPPETHEAHVKLEYIEGQRLHELLPTYVGQVDRCRSLASDLLNAIEHLEHHDLLHRDVKPDNVIVRDTSGEAVLIDFGAAAPIGAALGVAGTPTFLPPEAYFADHPPPSSDRYALAVLLFQALTGGLPFEDGGASLEHRPLASIDFLPEAERPFARALLRAIDLDPAARYQSAATFRVALLDTGASGEEEHQLPDLVNPWVNLVRGLYRHSARGNADNRGLDTEFARETYVPTALDERFLPAIFGDRPRAVFLSGNPGDGKTAFLERVQSELERRGGERVASDPSGWEWRLDGRTYRACYDASEAHGGKSADDQLRARLDGLEGDAPPREDLTVLVAINDGRLADMIDRFGDEFGWLTSEIEHTMTAGGVMTAGGAWLVDLKRRAFVSPRPADDNRSVMPRVLAALVAPAQWAICDGCSARHVCPIRRNAAALASTGNTDAGVRLEHALLLAHLRGERHITMRDLRSGLAFLITGDVGCREVHEAHSSGAPLTEHAYWQAAFTTDDDTDILLGEIRDLDPARFAQPRLERFFYFHRTAADRAARGARFVDGEDVPPLEDAVEWLARVKRRLYFEGISSDGESGVPAVAWPALLPYRYADRFVDAIMEVVYPNDFLPDLARGIGRSDGLSGPAVERGLSLNVAHSEVNQLTVLKQFPLSEFRVTVRPVPSGEVVEAFPEHLILTHVDTNARLEITLDLFELLLRLADGLEPTSPELQPLLEDLAPFKSAVQLHNSRDLILVEAERRLHGLTQQNGMVVLNSVVSGQAP